MSRKSSFCTLNLSDPRPPRVEIHTCPTRQRLASAFTRVQNIQLVRNHQQNPYFGKSAEDRLIWRELLDLEVQAVDEQIERALVAAESCPVE